MAREVGILLGLWKQAGKRKNDLYYYWALAIN